MLIQIIVRDDTTGKDEVEDDEVKDTTGSCLGEKEELTECCRLFKGSTDPIDMLKDIVLRLCKINTDYL